MSSTMKPHITRYLWKFNTQEKPQKAPKDRGHRKVAGEWKSYIIAHVVAAKDARAKLTVKELLDRPLYCFVWLCWFITALDYVFMCVCVFAI